MRGYAEVNSGFALRSERGAPGQGCAADAYAECRGPDDRGNARWHRRPRPGRRGDGGRAPVGPLDGGRAGRRHADPPLPPGVGEVIAVLRSSGILVDSSDRVVNNSPAAVAQGLVRGQELVHPELLHLARAVRRDGVIREAELALQKGLGDGPPRRRRPRRPARRRPRAPPRRGPLQGGARRGDPAGLPRQRQPRAQDPGRRHLAARRGRARRARRPRGGRPLRQADQRRVRPADPARQGDRRAVAPPGGRRHQGPAPSSTSGRAPETRPTAAGSSPTSTASSSSRPSTRAARCGATPSS